MSKELETKTWFATPTGDDYGHVSSFEAKAEGFGGDIATIWGEDAKENARLIAAAPDLLKATEALVRCIKDALQDDSIDASTEGGAILNGDVMCDALNSAQLAIAKARGE